MESFCITQNGLKILGSQVVQTTGLSYQEWYVEKSKAETQRKQLAGLKEEQKHAEEAIHTSEYAYGYHEHSQGAKASAASGHLSEMIYQPQGDMIQYPS